MYACQKLFISLDFQRSDEVTEFHHDVTLFTFSFKKNNPDIDSKQDTHITPFTARDGSKI